MKRCLQHTSYLNIQHPPHQSIVLVERDNQDCMKTDDEL